MGLAAAPRVSGAQDAGARAGAWAGAIGGAVSFIAASSISGGVAPLHGTLEVADECGAGDVLPLYPDEYAVSASSFWLMAANSRLRPVACPGAACGPDGYSRASRARG